jgi:hypothetical protein
MTRKKQISSEVEISQKTGVVYGYSIGERANMSKRYKDGTYNDERS